MKHNRISLQWDKREHAVSAESSSTAAFEYKEEAARYAEEAREIAERFPEGGGSITDEELLEMKMNIGTNMMNISTLSQEKADTFYVDGKFTEIQGQIGNIDAALESIKAHQDLLIGGDAE